MRCLCAGKGVAKATMLKINVDNQARRLAAAGAAAAWSARHGTDGHHRLTIRQPGGALDTDAVVKGGRLQRLTVSGPVVLGPEYVVEF